MKTTKQILSLAAAAMMLSAVSAQERGGVSVVSIHEGSAPAAVAERQQPLYVVDGRAIAVAELKSIEPSKIESVTIVKDKSAEAYAALGDVSNGVIIITLRSDDDKAYISVDEMPSFLGGDINTFRNWVQQQVRYPAEAIARNIQGDVVIRFTVGKDGLIEGSSLEALNSPDAILTDEVMRVLRQSPAWRAGRLDGRNVRVSLALPISFRMMGSDDEPKKGDAAAADNRGDAAEIVVVGFKQGQYGRAYRPCTSSPTRFPRLGSLGSE